MNERHRRQQARRLSEDQIVTWAHQDERLTTEQIRQLAEHYSAGAMEDIPNDYMEDVVAFLQREVRQLSADLAAQAAKAADIERQLHAEKRAYARLEKNHAVTVDAMCAYRDERTQAERRERELRELLALYGDRSRWWQADHLDERDGYTRKVWAWGDYRDPWTMAQRALAATVEAEPSAGQPPQTPTCWKCHPESKPGCIRPSSLLCPEHRATEKARLEVLKDQHAPGWRERE